MTFNPHNNVTADGVVITEGMKVATNELKVGIVRTDTDCGSGVMCCYPNGSEHTRSAQIKIGGVHYTDHELGIHLRDSGCSCAHDHWFTVETKEGSKTFNGERLGASGYGGFSIATLEGEYN